MSQPVYIEPNATTKKLFSDYKDLHIQIRECRRMLVEASTNSVYQRTYKTLQKLEEIEKIAENVIKTTNIYKGE